MTEIQAYQTLLMVFTSPNAQSMDYKAIVLRIAQNNPVAVVEALDNPPAYLDLNNPLVLTPEEEKMIRSKDNKIVAIKDLRTLRRNSGRSNCDGLKDCKDAVESLNIEWKYNPLFGINNP